MPTTSTTILLVEDSIEYRKTLTFCLGGEPDLQIWAQFTTADVALRYLKNQDEKPDLILLDLHLPGLSGIEALPHFKKVAPHAAILVLTESRKKEDILDAIARGAVGYLLKEASLATIIEGIRTVSRGGAALDPIMARFLLKTHTPKEDSEDALLTPRELEILTLVSQGVLQKQIADQLEISPKTVDYHVGQVYRKLGVPNAPAAIAKAYELGTFKPRK